MQHLNYIVNIIISIQGSAIADKPAPRAASWRTCCKQIPWTLSVINMRPN